MIREWTEHESRIGKGKSSFKILTGKPTGMRLLGRSKRKCEGNIRIGLNELLLILLLLLLCMLLIGRPMDFKIGISFLCSIDKLSFLSTTLLEKYPTFLFAKTWCLRRP